MKSPKSLFPKDFQDFIHALDANSVDYVVVGGWAMAAFGHQRMTKDLDVFVKASTANAQRLSKALIDFGAPKSLCSAQDFERPGMVTQLGVPPWRIDILTDLSGITFEEAKDRSLSFYFDGVKARVIGKEALIKNKKATNRTRDLLDVEVLIGSRTSKTSAPKRRK